MMDDAESERNQEMERRRCISMIYHWLNLLGVAIEWICKLPGQHNHHIDGQQNSHDHEQLIVLDHLLVQFYIGEY